VFIYNHKELQLVLFLYMLYLLYIVKNSTFWLGQNPFVKVGKWDISMSSHHELLFRIIPVGLVAYYHEPGIEDVF